MLANNNLKICRRLMWREFRFHKGRSMLLLIAVTLVSMLCTFSFALGFMVRDGLIYNYQIRYGSTSHILYYGLNSAPGCFHCKTCGCEEDGSYKGGGTSIRRHDGISQCEACSSGQ